MLKTKDDTVFIEAEYTTFASLIYFMEDDFELRKQYGLDIDKTKFTKPEANALEEIIENHNMIVRSVHLLM